MNKIKIIKSCDSEVLEEKINTFIKEFNNIIKVKDIKYEVVNIDATDDLYTAMIIYEEYEGYEGYERKKLMELVRGEIREI